MKRTALAVTAVVALLVAAVTAPAATAATSPRDVKPAVPIYLALGDSLAAGQQSAPPVGDFETTAELWHASGFVAQFHEVLREELDCLPARAPAARHRCRQLQLVSFARTGIPGGPGGVTTATMLQDGDQVDRAVELLRERNGDRRAGNDVEVITVTVGGNDLFGPAVAACVVSTATCGPTLASTFAGVAARYDQILAQLRAAAGPETLIMTTTYYNPLPFCDLGAADPAGSTALGNLILEGGSLGPVTLPTGFNDVIRAVSARYGATAVDTFGVPGAGDFVGGTDCLHPDAEGHRKIAETFAQAFARVS